MRWRRRPRPWVWYLITGAVLAVTRVALFGLEIHRFASNTLTETDYFLARGAHWLYPEADISIFRGLVGGFVDGTNYFAWGSVVTAGSFVMATPILVLTWLRQRAW